MQIMPRICHDFLWIYAKCWTRSKARDDRSQQLLNLTWKVFFPIDFVFYSVLDAETELLTVVPAYCHISWIQIWASPPLTMCLRPPGTSQVVVPFGQHHLLITSDSQFWSQRSHISLSFCWTMLAYSMHFHWLTSSYIHLLLCLSQKYVASVFFP